jgi:hypothetical protein
VKELFKEHEELLLKFNDYLPEEYKVSLEWKKPKNIYAMNYSFSGLITIVDGFTNLFNDDATVET